MLSLDEAIKHCLEVAEQNETQADKWQEEGGKEWGKTTACRECASEHRQLAEWLKELKDAKRLLRMAVVDMHDVLTSQIKITNYTLCIKCKYYLNCNCKDKCIARNDLKQWRYADEALKLIGDDENGTQRGNDNS